MPFDYISEKDAIITEAIGEKILFASFRMILFGDPLSPVMLVGQLARDEHGPRLQDHLRAIVKEHHPGLRLDLSRSPELIHATEDKRFERITFRSFTNYDENDNPFPDLARSPKRENIPQEAAFQLFGEHKNLKAPYSERIDKAYLQYPFSEKLREIVAPSPASSKTGPELEPTQKPKR